MKKFLALILMAATLFLLCSCAMTADKLTLRLEAMEEDGEIFYVAMDKEDLADEKEEILEDRQYQMKGNITEGYFVQSKKKITDFAYVLVYEKTADAKKAESFLTEDNETDPDFAAKREGKILIYGDAELIATIFG